MMLTSDHRTGDVTRCESMGLAGWLVKPVKASNLIDLIGSVAASDGESPQLPSVASRPDEPSQAEMRPRRILVVDDSVDNRSLIQAYLRKSNHQLVMAENGKTAIEAYKSDVFDLILMDMQMPVIDGYSATRAIRAIEGDTESRVPIVALTAYAFKEERQRSFEAGCDAHLTKPIRKKDLLAAIDKYGKCTTIVVEVDEEIRELIDGFLENRHADVKKLLDAVEIGDFETIRVLGHNMKGVGRNYGFDGITDIGALLEVAGKETETMNAQRQIAELIDYLDRVEIAK